MRHNTRKSQLSYITVNKSVSQKHLADLHNTKRKLCLNLCNDKPSTCSSFKVWILSAQTWPLSLLLDNSRVSWNFPWNEQFPTSPVPPPVPGCWWLLPGSWSVQHLPAILEYGQENSNSSLPIPQALMQSKEYKAEINCPCTLLSFSLFLQEIKQDFT